MPALVLSCFDLDINFDCVDILHMLQHDKDIIVGAYPKKDLNWNAIKNNVALNKNITLDEVKNLGANYALNFDWSYTSENKPILKTENGLIKLKDAATGFMLIKREVIEKMITAYPELYFNNDLNLDPEFEKWTYLFFDCMHEQDTKRYLSEDYAFCRRCQQCDGKIWADINTTLGHVGNLPFMGCLNDRLKA